MSTPRITPGTRFVGLPVSGGMAVAKVCLFNERRHSNLVVYRVSGEGKEREKNRTLRAVEVVSQRLGALVEDVAIRVGPSEARIFEAQKMIVGDSTLLREIFETIDTFGLNAETAVARTLDEYESRLLEVDNEYIKERATDIGEIRRRLVDVLADMNPSLRCEKEAHCQKGRGRIVVAEELTTGLTVELDTEHAAGFVTERGGPTSHAAILARALGIPAVSGIPNIHNLLSCGTELLLDGDTGQVVVWPSEESLARGPKRSARAGKRPVVEAVAGVSVMANISRVADVALALEAKAQGIGLYRTEFEFLLAGRLLDEEEQYERYSAVIKALAGRPACFRLLDIGGDKAAPFFSLPHEDNPSLGLRGSRLLLERTDLLKTQARALVRASAHGPVDVLYPMIVDLEQFEKLKGLFLQAVSDLTAGELRHGVMFEVPSACLQARELLEAAEMGSVGTNDLIQYLFAVDRNNELVARDYSLDRPVFWSVLEMIAAAADQSGRSVSVCGEAASNPRYLPKLLELGLNTLSVSPRFIADLRLAATELAAQRALKR